MKKKLAALAIAAPLIAGGLSGCAGGGQYHTVAAQSTYCVDATGNVVDQSWCNVGNSHFNPSIYVFWHGNSHGHIYHTGSRIPRSYYSSGKRINPSSSTARKAAGLPATGTVRKGSSPAKSQTAPSRTTGGKTSVGGSSAPRAKVGSSSGGGTSRSTGGFSGGRSSGGRR